MIRWIKKHKGFFFIIIVFFFGFLFIVIPIIINAMYIDNKGYMTVWGGEEVLYFYGSVLSFIGTVFLGGLSLWQNERLNKINKNLTEHQYKPILAISITNSINVSKENSYIWFRTIEQNHDGIMINNGYSSKPTASQYIVIQVSNIGLGPAINISPYIHKLTSVDGLRSLNEIENTNNDNFYDKIHLDNYEYYENNEILNGKWQIYTDFNLGISDENNGLNLAFYFRNIKQPIHSIIELQYENILGNRYKQFIYIGYIGKEVLLPISKVYQ